MAADTTRPVPAEQPASGGAGQALGDQLGRSVAGTAPGADGDARLSVGRSARWSRLGRALRTPRQPAGWARRWLVPLSVGTLVANIAIVLTGGAVRLTDSGLGCSTWPRCTDQSFTPHGALTFHAAVEFGNRMMSFVVAVVTIAAIWAALRARPADRRVLRLAVTVLLGVIVQAVVGGITVLTGLNSWVVGFHMLVSMWLVSVSTVLVWRAGRAARPWAPELDRRTPEERGSVVLPVPEIRVLTPVLVLAGITVLVLGTILTGAGPHAGDAATPRNGLDAYWLSHFHAWAVYVTVGVTAVLGFVLWREARGSMALRVVGVLLLVQLAQGAVGFYQYFNGLPELVVGLHLLGASLFTLALTWTVLCVRVRPHDPTGAPALP